MPDVLFTYVEGERYQISSTTCTCSIPNNTVMEYGTARSCTLIYKSPYAYRTMPQLHYHYINGSGEDVTLERKNFNRTGTNAYISVLASHSDLPDGESLIITVEPHIYNPNDTATADFKYSNSMTSSDCVCNIPNNSSVDIGVSTLVTLTYQRYRSNSDTPKLRYTYVDGNGQIIEIGIEVFRQTGLKTWEITTNFNAGTAPSGRQITVTVMPSICNTAFTIVNHLTNCETSAPDGRYDNEETTCITLTCEPGYEFQAIPTAVYVATPYEHTYQFEMVSETEYALSMTFPQGRTLTITGEAIKKSVINEKYGTIGVYRVDKTELRAISMKRWREITFDPQTFNGATVYHVMNEKYIDTAKYVVSLFKLPLSLEVGEKEALFFGPWDMEMQCDTVVSDIVTLDFGTVDVVGKYHNAIDYTNTELEIYLPYVGFVSLKVTDYMDRTVRLKYQINVLNGDALVILEADGHPMMSMSCNVAISVPYQLGNGEHQETTLNPNMTYIADTPPFIQVKAQNAVDTGPAVPYRDTKYYARLGTLTGYTQATEIDFAVVHDKITKAEIDEILSLIEAGIFL